MLDRISDRVVRIEVPLLRFTHDRVNIYLIFTSRGAIMVDCALYQDQAAETVERDFKELGLRASDLHAVIVSHGHIDHFGMAGYILERARCPVYFHEDDAFNIIDFPRYIGERSRSVRELVKRWGFDDDAADRVRERFASMTHIHAPWPEKTDNRLWSNAVTRVDFGDVAMEARHYPGHTPGLLAFYLPDARFFMSNDLVLQHITSNPDLYFGSYRGRTTGLQHYMESLRAVRDLDVSLVLPGHGPAFPGLSRRVDQILDACRRRREAVLASLSEPVTVAEMAGRMWKGLDQEHIYLAGRELEGHLEILLGEGRARRVGDGLPARYRLA